MSDQKKSGTPAAKESTYPDKTIGSEIASKVRKDANNWSEKKRAELFDKGMQIIYGGSGNKGKVCSRH
jgi:hypothetical protein